MGGVGPGRVQLEVPLGGAPAGPGAGQGLQGTSLATVRMRMIVERSTCQVSAA